MPAVIDAVRPDQHVRAGEAKSCRKLEAGANFDEKCGKKTEAFCSLLLILVRQVGQALKNPRLLASALPARTRAGTDGALPADLPLGFFTTSPPYSESDPAPSPALPSHREPSVTWVCHRLSKSQ